MLGKQSINTTAFHLQSNDMVERCNGQLKAALWARMEWPDHLPWVLFVTSSAPKEDSTISSAELMSSTTLSLPEFIQSAEPKAEQFLEKLQKLEMPATYICRGGRQASISLDGGEDSHVYSTSDIGEPFPAPSVHRPGKPNFSTCRSVAARRLCRWTA
jgi:hypothetical protein